MEKPKAEILQKNKSSGLIQFVAVLLMILAAAALRLIPHPPNFSPIAAMALFGGAHFSGLFSQTRAGKFSRILAFIFPLAALFLSDVALGFHDQMISVYFSFALVTILGFTLQTRVSPARVGALSLAGSLIFFVLTNFAVWAQGGMYERTLSGLIGCYALALPFLQNSIVGDLLFSAILFGAWALIEKEVRTFAVARLKR